MGFTASSILAWAKDGEELKDSYHVIGKSLLRLVTLEGDVDYTVDVDVVVDEVPF